MRDCKRQLKNLKKTQIKNRMKSKRLLKQQQAHRKAPCKTKVGIRLDLNEIWLQKQLTFKILRMILIRSHKKKLLKLSLNLLTRSLENSAAHLNRALVPIPVVNLVKIGYQAAQVVVVMKVSKNLKQNKETSGSEMNKIV